MVDLVDASADAALRCAGGRGMHRGAPAIAVDLGEVSRVHDCPSRETADQVDDQRTVGESAAESLSGPEGDQVASTGTGSASLAVSDSV
jgi:hypothetical protein